MKTIPENLTSIAQVVKSYGTTGEVVIKVFDELPQKGKEPVFINFDELPVPFFIDSIVARGNSNAIVKFSTINDLLHAEELVGQNIYAISVDGDKNDVDDLNLLNGFVLLDDTDKKIGTVSKFLDYCGNPCLEIKLIESNNQRESNNFIMPINNDLIIDIDEVHKILKMRIPIGLIDLNR